MDVSIDRKALDQAIRQLRPWIKKDRRHPARALIRLSSLEEKIQIVAGSYTTQSVREIPAKVREPGTSVVDGLVLGHFAKYAEDGELRLLSAQAASQIPGEDPTGMLLCQSVTDPEQLLTVREGNPDLFPDIQEDTLKRLVLRADDLPEPEEALYCRFSMPATEFLQVLRFFDLPVIHPAQDRSDLLVLYVGESAVGKHMDLIAAHTQSVYLFRQILPDDTEFSFSGTLCLPFSRSAWLPMTKRAHWDDLDRVDFLVYAGHVAVCLPGEKESRITVDTQATGIPNLQEAFREAQTVRQTLGVETELASWMEFFSSLDAVAETFPRVAVTFSGAEMLEYQCAEQGYAAQGKLSVRSSPVIRNNVLELDSPAILRILGRYAEVLDPDAIIRCFWRSDQVRLYWQGVSCAGNPLLAFQVMNKL